MRTGRRAWQCELSTIDSAFLLAGMLTCASYFDRDTKEETEVREIANTLYRRADWRWALAGGKAVFHGWRPATGFIPTPGAATTKRFSLISSDSTHQRSRFPPRARLPTRPRTSGSVSMIASFSTPAHCSHTSYPISGSTSVAFKTRSCPRTGATTSRTAVAPPYVQQEYAIRNPLGFTGYGEHRWGITATDGPGFEKRRVNVERPTARTTAR
jgi:Putative glucoamylase